MQKLLIIDLIGLYLKLIELIFKLLAFGFNSIIFEGIIIEHGFHFMVKLVDIGIAIRTGIADPIVNFAIFAGSADGVAIFDFDIAAIAIFLIWFNR